MAQQSSEGWGGKCQHQISPMGNRTLFQPQTPPRFPPAQGGFGGMGWGRGRWYQRSGYECARRGSGLRAPGQFRLRGPCFPGELQTEAAPD